MPGLKKLADEKRGRRSINDKAAREIKRLWGDLPVVDAKKELRVFVSEEDRNGAVPKDPSCCIFARACHRVYKSKYVLIFRTVAYVDLPNEKGQRRVERFRLGDGMRELVESFDKGDGTIPEGGFLLKPPTWSNTLDVHAATSRKSDEKQRERKKLQGERVASPEDEIQSKPIVLDLAVRSGSGAVHFTLGKKGPNAGGEKEKKPK